MHCMARVVEMLFLSQTFAFFWFFTPYWIWYMLSTILIFIGWHNPETAQTEAHKLLRSIVLLLVGNDVLSPPKSTTEMRFVDYGMIGIGLSLLFLGIILN